MGESPVNRSLAPAAVGLLAGAVARSVAPNALVANKYEFRTTAFQLDLGRTVALGGAEAILAIRIEFRCILISGNDCAIEDAAHANRTASR
jgi:hypothetical protein